MALPVGTSCNGCGKGLKARQIAVQCDHCDNWHMLLGSESLPETRQTSEGFRMFSFPAVACATAAAAAGGNSKPNVFIFIEEAKTTATNGEAQNQLPGISQSIKQEYQPYEFVQESDELRLKDSAGFRYTQRGVRRGANTWRCVVMHGGSNGSCPATVTQRGDNFTPGRMQHNHAVDAIMDTETAKSGVTCEVSQGLVSCQIEDAQITPVQLASNEAEQDQPHMFELVVGGTQLGNDMLIDNLGYSYRRKRKYGERLRPGGPRCKQRSFWQCCVYNSRVKCLASVTQKGDTFKVGRNRHQHPPGGAAARAIAFSTKTDRRSVRMKAKMQRESERKDWPLRPKDDVEVTYELLEASTQRHRSLLIDSLGYAYTLRHEGSKVRWRCSLRNMKDVCHADVTQIGDKFTPGRYAHIHPPNGISFKAISALKSRAVSQFFRSITSIVDEIIAEHADVELKRPNLIRIASRYRQHVLQAAGVSKEQATAMHTDASSWEEAEEKENEVEMTSSEDMMAGDGNMLSMSADTLVGTLPNSSMPPQSPEQSLSNTMATTIIVQAEVHNGF